MSEPISFTSTSARHALPFLFTAQAQKELFVNEAITRIDALLHPRVEGVEDTPPTDPADGACWLVGPNPVGDWQGHTDDIACRQAGNWLFFAPVHGMQLFDNAAGKNAFFDNGWQYAAGVTLPSGGGTQDTQSRTAIAELVSALVTAGILS